MQFTYWPFLILIVLIPIFHRFWKQRNRPATISYSLPIPSHLKTLDPTRLMLYLRYSAITFFIIALARPQSALQTKNTNVTGIDIMLVMDVSASMNIVDLSERSRFDIAKDTLREFIRGRQNDRIGFVMFSGEPLTLAPPTLDYGLVLKAVDEVSIGLLKDGTAIGDGLALAVNRLKTSQSKSRVIILLTDGDNNVGQIDPLTAGELATGYGIKTYTIAIGREGRVKMPIKQQGIFGNSVTTYQWFDNALNPELLQNIATMTGGKFYRVTEENALFLVFKEIDSLEKTDLKKNEKIKYNEHFSRPLKIGLLLLILERLLSMVLWRFVV